MTALAALTGMDGWRFALVLVTAAFYLGALLAAGGVLFRLVFPELPAAERRTSERMGSTAAWIALVLALSQWPLQAVYLGGGSLSAAVDPMLLGMVLESAQGTRLVLVLTGLLLIAASVPAARRLPALGHGLGVGGVLLIILGFLQIGHTVSEPRILLGGLLTAHLLAAAFWSASLWPLYRLAGYASGATNAAGILARFGRIAALAVGLLVAAGLTLAWWLLGGVAPLLTTAYGQFLLTKILIVALLLLLAATNKWVLVPAFARGDPQAPRRLRRSIALEALLVAVILLVTAVLTTISGPANG